MTIKKLRREKQWTQQKLAKEAGLSPNTIAKIEQGGSLKVRIDTVVKIADVFDVSIDELIPK